MKEIPIPTLILQKLRKAITDFEEIKKEATRFQELINTKNQLISDLIEIMYDQTGTNLLKDKMNLERGLILIEDETK